MEEERSYKKAGIGSFLIAILIIILAFLGFPEGAKGLNILLSLIFILAGIVFYQNKTKNKFKDIVVNMFLFLVYIEVILIICAIFLIKTSGYGENYALVLPIYGTVIITVIQIILIFIFLINKKLEN